MLPVMTMINGSNAGGYRQRVILVGPLQTAMSAPIIRALYDGAVRPRAGFLQLGCNKQSRIPATNILGRYEAPIWGFLLSGIRAGLQHRANKNGLYAHFSVLEHVVVEF